MLLVQHSRMCILKYVLKLRIYLRKEGNLGTEELSELGDNGRECCMSGLVWVSLG